MILYFRESQIHFTMKIVSIKSYLPLFLASLLLVACNNNKESAKEKEKIVTDISTTEIDTAITIQTATLDSIAVNYSFKPDSKLTPYRGKLVTAANWKDANGDNIIIISNRPQYFWKKEKPEMGKFVKDKENDTEVAEIFGYHYIYDSLLKKWKAYWTIHDFDFYCCDIYIEYQPKSLLITDIDSNRKAESSFFYLSYGGTSGIDHYYSAKMLLHVDSVKYKAEGTTGSGKEGIESSGDKVKESYDKKLNTLGESYMTYAKQLWVKYHKEQLRLDKIEEGKWQKNTGN
jgi:hypothetical protein